MISVPDCGNVTRIMSILPFLFASLLIELTPGPNMAYLAITALTYGKHQGYIAVCGIALGLLTVGIISSLGLTALLTASPLLYQALRFGGVFYLLWLAWEGWFTPEEETIHAEEKSLFRYFRQGLITNLLNPKAYIFYIAIMPEFTDPERSIFHQTLILSFVYVSVATAIHAAIVTVTVSARRFFEDRKIYILTRKTLSGLLAVAALWLIWETRK